jgi:hypothetical protein
MDWQSLPEWIRYGIMVLIRTTLGALITLFREALIGFLRRLAQKWADRRFERMSQEFSLGLAFHSGIRP